MKTERLRDTRESLGWSRQELADRAEISLSQLQRYENGESDPTSEPLARIARELGVSADFLMGLSSDPRPRFTENDLSKDEQDLLSAFRRGDYRELMRVAVTSQNGSE